MLRLCLAVAAGLGVQASFAAEFNASMAPTQSALASQPALKVLRDGKAAATPAAKSAAIEKFAQVMGGDFEDMADAGMRELTLLPGFDQKLYDSFAALPAPRSQVSSMTTCPAGQDKPVVFKTAVKGVNATFDFRGLDVLSAEQRRQLEQQPSLALSVSGVAGEPAVTVYSVFAPLAEKRKALPLLRYEPTALSAKASPMAEFERCDRPSTRAPAQPDTALLPRVSVPDARPGSERPFEYTDDLGRKWWLALDPQSGNWALAHRFQAGEEALAQQWFETELAAHRKAGDAAVTISRMRMDAPGIAPVQLLNQAVFQYADDVTETMMLVANRNGIQLVRRFVR